jgi:hypothetical protein
MTDLRAAAQQALEAWEHINLYGFVLADYEGPMEQAITALKAALEVDDAAAELRRLHAEVNELKRTLALQQRSYEREIQIEVEAEREACAKVCDARYMGDNNREDMEARRCAAAIRERGNT